MASITKKIGFSKPELSWAKLVSDVMSPPVVWGALVLLIGYHHPADDYSGLYWSGVFAILICLLPLTYIMYMVARGKIGDLHMRRRQDRYKPLMLTIVSSLVAWYVFKTQGAPPAFAMLSLMTAVQLGVILLVTLVWQISMHAMAITSVVVASEVFFGTGIGLALVPLVALVGAARLSLNCHTPPQIFAGAMVGMWVPIGILVLISHNIYLL